MPAPVATRLRGWRRPPALAAITSLLGGIVLIGAVLVAMVVLVVAGPFILANAVSLHPLMILLAVTTGALTLGVLGAFIAVPIAAIAARLLGSSDDQPDVAEGPVEVG